MNIFKRRLLTDVPLISEAALAVMVGTDVTDFKMAEHPMFKRLRDTMKPQCAFTADGIAVLPIEGILAQKPDPFEMLFYGPMEDTQAVAQAVEDLSNSVQVRGVLLHIDSPGGFVTGGPEVADQVADMAKRKPVVAFTDGAMASLAYFIGSQANAVVSTRSAHTGSIGAYGTIVDYTKRLEALGIKVEMFRNKEGDLKGAGVIGTSLTDVQREYIQASVEESFSHFKSAVLSKRQVPDSAMRGQSFTGHEAQRNKIVDVVGTKESALRLVRKMMGSA